MYYHSLNEEMKKRFGCKVYKLSLSSGCTCPNRDGKIDTRGCIFCDGAGAFSETGSISSQLEQAKKRLHGKDHDGKYIAYFQSFTNTYAPAEKLKPLFEEAISPDNVVALSVATRPDCLPDDILSLLSELNSKKDVWVELGLQTIHPKTAEYIRRGYDLSVFEDAVKKLHSINIEVIAHLILGLSGETVSDMEESSAYTGKLVDGVKLHLLHVLRGTDLEKDYLNGNFRALEMNEYIYALERCISVIPQNVVIHRLTGDGAKKDLIAPLWSANKKLVLNSIYKAFERDGLVQGSRI